MTRFEQLQAFRDLTRTFGLVFGLWVVSLGVLLLIELALANAWERHQRRRRGQRRR